MSSSPPGVPQDKSARRHVRTATHGGAHGRRQRRSRPAAAPVAARCRGNHRGTHHRARRLGAENIKAPGLPTGENLVDAQAGSTACFMCPCQSDTDAGRVGDRDVLARAAATGRPVREGRPGRPAHRRSAATLGMAIDSNVNHQRAHPRRTAQRPNCAAAAILGLLSTAMEIIEETSPSDRRRRENIAKGFNSVLYAGFNGGIPRSCYTPSWFGDWSSTLAAAGRNVRKSPCQCRCCRRR